MKDVRAFVAIELPQAVKDELAEVSRILATRTSGYRWAKPDTVHLTLRFLGFLGPKRFGEVAARLEAGVKAQGPVRLAPCGVGGFPTQRKARVIWVGLDGELGKLHALSDALDEALEAVGIPRENRPFKAHLTIGRETRELKGSGLPPDADLADWRGGGWKAAQLVLYESKLTKAGAEHLERARGKII